MKRGIKILLVLLLVYVMYTCLFYINRPRRAVKAAEEMRQYIPAVQEFVTNNIDLMNDVQDSIDEKAPEVSIKRAGEKEVVIYIDPQREWLSPDLWPCFTQEEKEKIITLFTLPDFPFYTYDSKQYFFPEKSSVGHLVDLRMTRSLDGSAKEWALYYVEVAENWYVYPTINMGIDLEKYKAERQGDG